MSDLINRQDAIDAAINAVDEWDGGSNLTREDMIADAINNTVPSAEPERKKGKWTIKTGKLAIWDVCSECKKMVIHKAPFYNYCPNCGADMRGKQE